MARTGCGGERCSCLITAGPGMVVDGSGTSGNPYVITREDLIDPPEPEFATKVVSLKVDSPQTIPADGAYHIVRFPYTGESYDPYNMHDAVQPDGYQVVDWATDDRSGLIWPGFNGWGLLTALIQWESGDYTELRDQFVRSPFTSPDTTATDHRAPSPGANYFTKHHEIFVAPSTPIALRVAHNDATARQLTLAEFKIAILP
ncbi:hypothetical protein [Streptomyces alfalfae]